MAKIQKITPFLWFDNQAEEAANFYVSIFKNSKIGNVVRHGDAVIVVGFELEGLSFTALNAGPKYKFTEAISFVVNCQDQAEVDYFWEKLTADGGQESQCAWLKDKFGLSWQIVPEVLPKLLSDPDPERAQRVMATMLNMQKINIAALERAHEGPASITVESTVNAPVQKVWQLWSGPEHIEKWNHASDDWHTPKAVNDLRVGGSFVYTMAAKDGSFSFDFDGVYDEVAEHQRIAYTMADGRKALITFTESGGATQVTETFDAEDTNSLELQRGGWQAILDNFKTYVEES